MKISPYKICEMIEKRNGNSVANVGRLKGDTDAAMFSTLSDRMMYCSVLQYVFGASKRGNERYVYDRTLSPV
ncbi:hypothetical protein KSF_092210 [Reticulibacter mediterranei]|uniref:Uncharacterized protein n=1 Tax=Reticulibacter mediterranei TaxID=2778369 RepID=A0A8J3N805_9CHLR|nr:hypothetical protein KSF_092210 [Reticulibacter mediterranei]